MRVSGIVLPINKHVCISLTSIYGIGRSLSLYICRKLDINPSKKVIDLTRDEVASLQVECTNYLIEGDLRRKVSLDLKHLREIKCYRGMRHRLGLPVRGQRTKTNSRSSRRFKFGVKSYSSKSKVKSKVRKRF